MALRTLVARCPGISVGACSKPDTAPVEVDIIGALVDNIHFKLANCDSGPSGSWDISILDLTVR